MDNQEYINKSFPNPYLTSVAFELKFPSDIQMLEKFPLFQTQMKDDFPFYSRNISVIPNGPQIAPVQHILENEYRTTKIQISHDAIVVIVRNYDSFDNFKNRVIKCIDPFFECFPMKFIYRMGLRYFQKYDFESKNESERRLEFQNLFKPLWNLSIMEQNEVITHNIEIRKIVGTNFAITMRAQLDQDPKWTYILDFDVYFTQKSIITKYKEILAQLRAIEKKHFLNSVTQNYLKKIGA